MKPISLAIALGVSVCFAGAVVAQSPLSSIPNPAPANWFLWTGCASPNVFFNLNVNTTITVQGLDLMLDNFAGAEGTVEVWVTNPGTTTYLGSETNQAAWTLAGSGPVTSAGYTATSMAISTVGLTPGVVLQPGSHGIAVHYNGVRAAFVAGTGANQTVVNTEATMQLGSVQPLSFSTAPSPGYVWLGAIRYLNGAVAHATASNTYYGSGCNTTNGSFYQRFICTGTASTALSGRSLAMTFVGTGYAVSPGTATFIPPTAAANSLPANDDGETMVALTTPLPYPGGLAPVLWVNTNGFVSVASNPQQTPAVFSPSVAGLLDSPQTAWWSWHDYNASEAGSGTIKFEEVGSLVLITWDGVESYPDFNGTTPVVNPSTWQFQFDTATGNVNYVWQSITATGGSTYSDEHIIGYSPGGPSPTSGAIDLATLTAEILTEPEAMPLALRATPVPLLGNTVDYETSNQNGQGVGLFFFCLASLPPVDLTFLGMTGCSALVDIGQGVGNVISNLPGLSMTVSVPVPVQASLIGAELFGQSIWFDPTANPFGAVSSNGVRSVVGNF